MKDTRIHRRAAQGLTLPEALLATAVLAFAVIAVTQAIVAAQTQAEDALVQQRAMSLAEAMLEEILSLPYADPEDIDVAGPDTGETTRQLFDNMDDYHGYSEAVGALTDITATAYPDTYQRFARSVTASFGSVNVAALGGNTDGLTVTVTITDTPGRTWTLSRFVPEPAEDD